MLDFISSLFGPSDSGTTYTEFQDPMDAVFEGVSAGDAQLGADQEAAGNAIVQESLGQQIVADTQAGLVQESLGQQIVNKASADWLTMFGNTAKSLLPAITGGPSAGSPALAKNALLNSYSSGPTITQLALGIGAIGVLAYLVGRK